MDMRIVTASADCRDRLGELGLVDHLLVASCQRGFYAWATCTNNYPPFFRSLYAWAETVVGLRENLIPLGWQRLEEEGLALVANAEKQIAISVATGNEATGRREGALCTKSGKGAKTIEFVAENQLQAELFPRDQFLPVELSIPQQGTLGRTIWVLLFHRDLGARELRCELACPIEIAHDGRINGWRERIILPTTPFDGQEINLQSADLCDMFDMPDTSIEIVKRV